MRGRVEVEGETQAESLLNVEPDLGLDLMTLRSDLSWNQELDAQWTATPRCPTDCSFSYLCHLSIKNQNTNGSILYIFYTFLFHLIINNSPLDCPISLVFLNSKTLQWSHLSSLFAFIHFFLPPPLHSHSQLEWSTPPEIVVSCFSDTFILPCFLCTSYF